jgi:hypothetical protein
VCVDIPRLLHNFTAICGDCFLLDANPPVEVGGSACLQVGMQDVFPVVKKPMMSCLFFIVWDTLPEAN